MTDEEQIRALQNSYCERFDARDADGYAGLYLENATVTAPWGQIIAGRDKLRKGVVNTPPGGWHKALECEIAVKGDTASATCRFEAQVPGEEIDHGYYEDTYQRTDEGWKFATRKVILDSREMSRPARISPTTEDQKR